ncbi:MAG: uncharacterized protein KVP18_002385 [Porospora cf. gigantea A]|uniref:uncharacterized protein n=1 Tax=Porospora cf. gigantea A TaxID=2853593 RepID=UPI003559BE3F|nr:MAG: hypothetical protein KVP18_002385 [Porospora cf. gigantea A]
MLWIDKHQPLAFGSMTCHRDLNQRLEFIARTRSIPHLLFYGPSGGGKGTRIMALLRELYGLKVNAVSEQTLKVDGGKAEVSVISSLYHTQISISDLGTKDRLYLQTAVKNMASHCGSSLLTGDSGTGTPTYRVLVIREAEALSFGAQAALRRTMERFTKTCRIIMHCEELANIIPSLRSRCHCIRVPLPSEPEVCQVLASVWQQEQCSTTLQNMIADIAKASGRDLRNALLLLEEAAVRNVKNVKQIRDVPWEAQCGSIAQKISSQPSVKTLLEVREMLYEMWVSCIPSQDVLVKLMLRFLGLFKTDPLLRLNIVKAAQHYSHSLHTGSKDIWHLEAFIANVAVAVKNGH